MKTPVQAGCRARARVHILADLCSLRGAFFLFALGLCSGSPLHAASASPHPLLRAGDIRKLPPEQAALALPVQMEGVVTALSGYKNSFFVQDETAGISVDRTDSADVHVGDRVAITGTSGPGFFAPIVLASAVHVLGHAPQPPARAVTFADLIGGAEDSQRIEVQGVVQSTRITQIFHRDTLTIVLNMGAASINILLQDFAEVNPARLIDATIRVRGVCSTGFNEKRQFVAVSLFAPKRSDLTILHASQPDPFGGELRPIRKAFQFGTSAHRVKISGIVTYQVPGHLLFLQDREDGMKVQTSYNEAIPFGSRVEAVGFPAAGDYTPLLEEAVIRVVAPPVWLLPHVIEAKDVIVDDDVFYKAFFDGQLVQVQGEVVESSPQAGGRNWILRQGDHVFGALLVGDGKHPIQDLPSGSILRVTGICSIITNSERRPLSFQILLRSPADVVLLHRASWWTPAHTLSLLGALGGIIIAVTLWVVALRKRVEQQTEIIRQSEGRFRDLAERDVLTGLPNRLMLEEHIAACLAECRRERLRAAVLTIDIDRFKQVNDLYGHLSGDECLRIVAARLQRAIRQGDIIARTGGEEFTIVATGLSSVESATSIACGILALFREPMELRGQQIDVTVSVGGALYPDDGGESEILRKRSDQALYEAKRTGRNRAVFATEQLCAALERSATTETALREAIHSVAFTLEYQPIFDASGAIRRFEALLRTTDSRLAELGPADFIPVAENSGLIIPLGRWILGEACRQMSAWQDLGMNPYPVAVNISGRQLLHPGFADDVLGLLRHHRLDPGVLELELTETAAMTSLNSVGHQFAQLAEAGVTFSIDDFGTGYSSLARLHELPIQALKIDRSFVRDLLPNNPTHTIIRAVIRMAKSLRLQVIAEGVETEEQFALLRDLECDFFQGYLFARPLPAEMVPAALARNRAIDRSRRAPYRGIARSA